MRATISFDIDVGRVEETMSALVEQQAGSVRLAATILENTGKTTLLEEVTSAIELLRDTTSQLQQYQKMLASFEKSRFETMLPQPSQSGPPLTSQVVAQAAFDEFIGAIDEEESNDPEEG